MKQQRTHSLEVHGSLDQAKQNIYEALPHKLMISLKGRTETNNRKYAVKGCEEVEMNQQDYNRKETYFS